MITAIINNRAIQSKLFCKDFKSLVVFLQLE